MIMIIIMIMIMIMIIIIIETMMMKITITNDRRVTTSNGSLEFYTRILSKMWARKKKKLFFSAFLLFAHFRP